MLLYFGNPDHDDSTSIQTHFDRLIHYNLGAMGSLSIRPDGYGGRPGLTSSGGHVAVEITPKWPLIHPVGNFHRSGARFLWESYPASPEPILVALNPGAEICACAALNPDGTVSIYRGNPNTTGSEIRPSNTVLALNTFHRVGFAAHISRNSSEGYIQLNRTVICRAPLGANLEGVENQSWSGAAWGILEDSAVSHYYCGDSYGHQPGLLPSLLVQYTRPADVNALIQWLATVSPYYEAINDSTPDDDSSYMDAYVPEDGFLAGSSAFNAYRIFAGQLSARVRNVVDYGPAFRHLLQVNGIMREGDVDFSPELYYQIFRHIYYQSPDDGYGFEGKIGPTTLAMGGRMIGS